ncbi:MAG TPA: hypothetical protein VIZ20_20520 [Streptosporangiaceae bacterium]
MGLDRPAPPPDQPTPERPADHPAPPPPDDPWNVANLTRAQAFESLRRKAEAADIAVPDAGAPLAKGSESPANEPGDRPEQRVDRPRGYWTEVPRFFATWRDHADQWPGVRSEDQPSQLAGAESRRVDAEAERVTQAENIISDDVQRFAGECSRRTWLGGFEFRLKNSERIKEKVADKLDAEPDRSSTEVVQGMADAIRYTYCFDATDYASGFADIKGRLEASGYEMYYSKNFWADSEYKGVNSRWITSEGQRFEVQFHTAESFHAKHEVTHLAYERIRDPRTSEHERGELREFQRDVSSWIPIPPGALDISDSKKESPDAR